ncbi:MAG: hypothetical protein K0Q71_3815 [Thermomicrobiales bacterium]|nr:hypothetical protein [Thermomicrobiales bacterium]
MDLHEALRTVRAHGLHVVMAGGQKAKALAAAGAVPVPVPEYPNESEAARAHRLWYRSQLEAADREARLRPAAPAPVAAAGRSAGDLAEFPPPPASWSKNSELHVPRPVERPMQVLNAGDYALHPGEPDWSAPRGGPASRAAPVQTGDTGYAPMPVGPWG